MSAYAAGRSSGPDKKSILKLEVTPLCFVCTCGWVGNAKEEWHDHRVAEILHSLFKIPAASEAAARKAIRAADEAHGAFMMRAQ